LVFAHDGLQLAKYVNLETGAFTLPRSTILWRFECLLVNNGGLSTSTATVRLEVQFSATMTYDFNTNGRYNNTELGVAASPSATYSNTFGYQFVIADTGGEADIRYWFLTPDVLNNGGANDLFISRLRIFAIAV
jgi:hypothetical protein